MSDISKGKLLTWISNASSTVNAARDRAGDTKEGARCDGKLIGWGVLREKIIQGQFDVENVLGEQ